MSDVFQEVDEDLRQQEMENLWRRFGPWVISAAVIAIAVSSAFMYWRNHQEAVLGDASDKMLTGIEHIIAGENSEAAVEFASLAEAAPDGYRMLALFQQAAAERLSGNLAGAIIIYDQLADDSAIEENFRDLASLYGGLSAVAYPDFGFEDAESRLGPVASGTSPWRYHALEGLGFAAYDAGRFSDATGYYRQITDDALAPEGIAGRANEMLNMTESAASAATE